MVAKPAPPLNVPSSNTTVKISAIDSGWTMGGLANVVWQPPIQGFDSITFMGWSFLIEHPSGRKVLYDLGFRKDWENLAPSQGIKAMVDAGMLENINVKDDVPSILTRNGIKLEDIEAVIWSHWHFDHTGDPSLLPGSVKLIVGPGFKEVFMPGYPADPEGRCVESDFKGREVEELNFSKSNVTIGRFKALDYFGDGSFYILDAPGHAIGHLNALVRTHASPNPAFIHLGGDSLHHVGEIRPSQYMPLPDEIKPSPLPDKHRDICPGHIFSQLLPNGSKKEHILTWVEPRYDEPGHDRRFGLVYDKEANADTVAKDEELDADKDVFTIIAHDGTVKGVIPEFPESLNQWREKDLKEEVKWKFLGDFKEAVV